MLDMLDFLLLSSRTTNHLDSYDVLKDIDPKTGYGQRIRIKALGPDGKGDTWDISLYDQHWVYDFITELAYHTPRDYKKFVKNHRNLATGKIEDGIVMYPRFVNADHNYSEIATPKDYTLYRKYVNCKQVSEQSLGNVNHILAGPFLIDHGKDVGLQPTMIQQYFWTDNGSPVCEENYLVYKFGWCRWMLKKQNPTTGIYEMVKQSLHNTLHAGGSPGYVFPCFS
jgi:hypothetical protein